MKLMVVNSKGIGALLIKTFTFSKWNHSAIFFEQDDTVVDATFFHGVRNISFDEFVRIYPNYEIIEVDIPDEEAAKQFALAQVGKGYDLTAIFGMILQRRWEDDDSWFCSELAEAIILAGGKRRYRSVVSRITPQQNWAVI